MSVYKALKNYKLNRNEEALFRALNAEIALIDSFFGNSVPPPPTPVSSSARGFLSSIYKRPRKNISNNLARRAISAVPNTVANKTLKTQRFLKWLRNLPGSNNRNNANALYKQFSQQYTEQMSEFYNRTRRAPRRVLTSNEEEWLKNVRNNTGERNRFRTYLTSLPKSNTMNIANVYNKFKNTTGEVTRRKMTAGLGKLLEYGSAGIQKYKNRPRRSSIPENFNTFVTTKGLNTASRNRFKKYILNQSPNNKTTNQLFNNFKKTRFEQARSLVGRGIREGQLISQPPNNINRGGIGNGSGSIRVSGNRQRNINNLVNRVSTGIGGIRNFPSERKLKLRKFLEGQRNLTKFNTTTKLISEFTKYEQQKPFFRFPARQLKRAPFAGLVTEYGAINLVEGLRKLMNKVPQKNNFEKFVTRRYKKGRTAQSYLNEYQSLRKFKNAYVNNPNKQRRFEQFILTSVPYNKRNNAKKLFEGSTSEILRNRAARLVGGQKRGEALLSQAREVELTGGQKRGAALLSQAQPGITRGNSVSREAKIKRFLNKYHQSINEAQLRKFMNDNPNMYKRNINNIKNQFRKRYPIKK